MTFHIITLFPNIFSPYLKESVLGRAIQKGLIRVTTHNPRDYANDKHKTTDDTPYGGGAGMVLKAEPILKAVQSLKIRNKKGTKIILLSAKGKMFNQKMAHDLARKYRRIIFIAGRYEGIDERVKKILRAEEISLGPYVLTDGDVAAMAMISAVSRLIPGVIKPESLKEESYSPIHRPPLANRRAPTDAAHFMSSGREYPHYTRPETLAWKGKKYRVPKVLRSGDHKNIAAWRRQRS